MHLRDPLPRHRPRALLDLDFRHEFALRWYALAYIAGIVIGWRIIVAAVKRNPALWPGDRAPMTPGCRSRSS
jgi:phosphatidylglycerol---prolipoprotein diacylglyceryl transferase